jgi:hypothetical protein
MGRVFLGIRSSVVCYVDFYLLRCSYIARYLAANFGTKVAAFPYKSSVLYMIHLGVLLLSLLSSVICYFHQIEMISFIKLETCRLICGWLRWLFNLFLSFLNLRWEI